jgi:hypothetical protein
MNVGIGLSAAVPDTDMTGVGRWAAEAERAQGVLGAAYLNAIVGDLRLGPRGEVTEAAAASPSRNP